MYDERDQNRELGNKEATRVKFRLLGPLGKAHNIVVYIRGSAGYTEAFRKLTERMIPIDNHTR